MYNEAPPSGAIYQQILFLRTKFAVCQIPEYLDDQFMRTFSKIHILHFFAPYWAPISASPLICTHFNSHSPKMLPTNVGSNQFNGLRE